MGMLPTRFSHNSPGLYNPTAPLNEPARVATIARALWAAPGAGAFHVPVAPAFRGQASMSVHPVVVFSAGPIVGLSVHPRTRLDDPRLGDPLAHVTLHGSAVRPEVAAPVVRAITAHAPESPGTTTAAEWDLEALVGETNARPSEPGITTDPANFHGPAHVRVAGRDIHVSRPMLDTRAVLTPLGAWTHPVLAAVVEAMAQPALGTPTPRLREAYAPVVDALTAAGHVARVALDDEYPVILVVLPDGSRLHIADADHDDELPDHLGEVATWTAMHHRWDDPLTDYLPEDVVRVPRTAPADDAHMVEAVTAYVRAMREFCYRRPPTT
ncbi:hypothetical protein [Embleya sp. NPDC020630]|uniref:hypothetical protein n=1 Tax=Embleya sp. NPDC020630 TaxID=3363979 RepID=UPI0037A9146A